MQNVFKQFGAKGTGSFSERFNWSIVRLTVFYSLTLIVILTISGFISYKAFSQRIGHRFHPIQLDTDTDSIVIAITPATPHLPTPEDLQHDLLISFLMVNISLVALAIALSYWLAKKTLAPIETAYEEQQQFLSDVSHELRTPIAILQLDLENDNSAKSASRLEEVHRMGSLVNDILRLSRIDQHTYEITPIAIGSLIQTIIDRLSPLAAKKNVTLSLEPTTVSIGANEDLLSHALTNLIQNAIIYNKPDGTVTITVAERAKDITITIVDTGVGIAPEDLKHIFKRFYRADKSRTRSTGGSGLGLSIVQSAIERMHGTIDIKSKLEHGTTISIYLPK